MTSRRLAKLLALTPLLVGGALAQPSPQTPLRGSAIPRWNQPLPRLGAGFPVAGGTSIHLSMCEFQTQILPPGTVLEGVAQRQPLTTVWGYVEGTCPPRSTVRPNYLGPVILATRGVPTAVTFTNGLGHAAGTGVLAYRHSLDQTLHWADPLGTDDASRTPGANRCATGERPTFDCSRTYDGPIPAGPHLHGGEVPPEVDGGPDQWFTSDGLVKGPGYYAGLPATTGVVEDGSTPSATPIEPNQVRYVYPNAQEAAPIWFHDHTLGATRLNVYAGLSGAYVIHDPAQVLPAGFPPAASAIPLVLQDRTFDTRGQLLFPAARMAGVRYAPNPEHPYWLPEFIGDAIVVNGKAWPYLDVEPRRYRFLVLNGSNARTYDLSLPASVRMYVVGNDGGYLDAARPVKNLVVMPGERYELVIDFSAVAPGQPFKAVVLTNTARAPYPGGARAVGPLGELVQFRVRPCKIAGTCGAGDPSWNPAVTPAIRAAPMVRLDPAAATVRRALTLNEVMGVARPATTDPIDGKPAAYPGGPLELLLNNTKWKEPATERSKEGATEIWEIVNLTADAHPIHLHLVHFQVMNRQSFDVDGYAATYAAAFTRTRPAPMPCTPGALCEGSGPPLPYDDLTAGGYLGGNPDVAPFLRGGAVLPAAQESGWKDTVAAPPGMVTRLVVRWSPTSTPASASGAPYPFDPGGGGKRGYVWHCHLLDHEDNEMMRPSVVQPIAGAARTWVKGVHY